MVIYIVFFLGVWLNGATDAANSLAGAVYSGALSYNRAALLSAVMNVMGLITFVAFSPKVAVNLSRFEAGGGWAVMLSVVGFTFVCWLCSLPTSESHAMLAAMAGASSASLGGEGWSAMLIMGAGAGIGALGGAIISFVFRRTLPRKLLKSRIAAIAGCIVSSFLHGAQDGQKFLALAVASRLLEPDLFSALAVGTALLLGTFLGGRKTAERLGEKMTCIDMGSAVASDMGSAAALLASTLLGIPASTTHAKTCAFAGAAAGAGQRIDKKQLGMMVFAWVITFPLCFFLAYFITKTIN